MANEFKTIPYGGPYDQGRIEQAESFREELLARIEKDATLNLNFAGNRYRIYEGLTDGDTLKPFNSALTYSRLSSATGFNRLKLLGTALDDQHRLVSDPATGESLGLLVEGSATNSLLHNRDLSQSTWSRGSGIVVTQNAVGLNGVANAAWTVEATSDTENDFFSNSVSIANDTQTHAVAHYLEKTQAAATFPAVDILLSGGTAVRSLMVVNTDTGETKANVSDPGTSVKVDDLGSHYKITMTATNNGTGNTTLRWGMFPAFNTDFGNVATPSTVGASYYDYGQVILNSTTVGSPILTGASAATRAADVVSQGEVGKWFARKEGTLIYEGIIPRPYDGQIGSGAFVFQIYKSGLANNGIGFVNSSIGNLSAEVPGFTAASFSGVYGEKIKIGLSFSADTLIASFNGNSQSISGNLNDINPDTALFSGLRSSASRDFEQTASSVVFDPAFYTAAELDAITGA